MNIYPPTDDRETTERAKNLFKAKIINNSRQLKSAHEQVAYISVRSRVNPRQYSRHLRDIYIIAIGQ